MLTPGTLYERVGPTSPDDAVRWVDSLAALEPDHIKVRNWPAPDIARALVARARQRGLPVVGHANEPFPRTGVDTLEHHIWPPLAGPTATREALWRQLAASGTALVPTLVTWPIRLDPPDTAIARLNRGAVPGWRYIPAPTREKWRNQFLELKQERPLDWTRISRGELRNVAEMQKEGITLLAGTDVGAPLLVPGSSLHDELALLVSAAGMTPLQALRAATTAPARVVGHRPCAWHRRRRKARRSRRARRESAHGYSAYEKDPGVVANGRLLDRAALDRLLTEAEAATRTASR